MRISDVLRRAETIRAVFHPDAEMYMWVWGSGGPRSATMAVTTQRLLVELPRTRVGSDAVLSYEAHEVRRLTPRDYVELHVRVPRGYTLHLTFGDADVRDRAAAAVSALKEDAEPASDGLERASAEERLQALQELRDSGAISQDDYDIEAARIIAADQE